MCMCMWIPIPNRKMTRQEMFEQVLSLLLTSHHLYGRGVI